MPPDSSVTETKVIAWRNKFIIIIFFYLSFVPVLKKAFDAFDREKKGCIGTDMVKTILEVLGTKLDDDIVEEVDSDGI